MCDSRVQKAVQAKLDVSEAFTTGCISHPIIASDAAVRHRDCSRDVRSLWNGGQMIGSDGSTYVRTNITVWPDGPGSSPSNAWLYHPDDYDVDSFKPRTRVLVRGAIDHSAADADDSVVNITSTADGSTVVKQCQVQQKEKTLNIPRKLIQDVGWAAGQELDVDVTGSIVTIKIKSSAEPSKQQVDKEGRVRLHGATVDALATTRPLALLVDPKGAAKYLQIVAVIPTTSPAPADDGVAATSQPKGVSVWAK